jgi:hypothetical protein
MMAIGLARWRNKPGKQSPSRLIASLGFGFDSVGPQCPMENTPKDLDKLEMRYIRKLTPFLPLRGTESLSWV